MAGGAAGAGRRGAGAAAAAARSGGAAAAADREEGEAECSRGDVRSDRTRELVPRRRGRSR